MSNKKRIVIVGATSAIAQHCARLWLQGSEVDLVLIGREQQRLEIIAADFKVRNSGAHIVIEQANFTDVASIVEVARKVMDQGKTAAQCLSCCRQWSRLKFRWHRAQTPAGF